jgi:hypothetical protein
MKPAAPPTLTAIVDLWFRRHPTAMVVATLALTIGAAVALLFVGHSEPILYQAF